MFAVSNVRDREIEDHMESILSFLHENKSVYEHDGPCHFHLLPLSSDFVAPFNHSHLLLLLLLLHHGLKTDPSLTRI